MAGYPELAESVARRCLGSSDHLEPDELLDATGDSVGEASGGLVDQAATPASSRTAKENPGGQGSDDTRSTSAT